jgi:hypothetical protein
MNGAKITIVVTVLNNAGWGKGTAVIVISGCMAFLLMRLAKSWTIRSLWAALTFVIFTAFSACGLLLASVHVSSCGAGMGLIFASYRAAM